MRNFLSAFFESLLIRSSVIKLRSLAHDNSIYVLSKNLSFVIFRFFASDTKKSNCYSRLSLRESFPLSLCLSAIVGNFLVYESKGIFCFNSQWLSIVDALIEESVTDNFIRLFYLLHFTYFVKFSLGKILRKKTECCIDVILLKKRNTNFSFSGYM